MPYKIRPAGKGKVAVVKRDGGKVVGHTTSKRKAKRMIRAIYANENKIRPAY